MLLAKHIDFIDDGQTAQPFLLARISPCAIRRVKGVLFLQLLDLRVFTPPEAQARGAEKKTLKRAEKKVYQGQTPLEEEDGGGGNPCLLIGFLKKTFLFSISYRVR